MALTDYVSEACTALQQEAGSWEEAVRLAGGLLERQGHIDPSYTEAMVNMVKELGPYIVIMPGVALTRARFLRLQSLLMRLDFPTLDRPEKTNSGRSLSGSWLERP